MKLTAISYLGFNKMIFGLTKKLITDLLVLEILTRESKL